MRSPEVAPRNWDKWRHGAARLRSPRFARASVVRVWMHLAAVIFLLGGRRDEGLARESPCGERPECFRLRALAPRQTRSPTGARATANPTAWLRRPSHSESSQQTPCLAETCGISTRPFAARRKFSPRGESITEEGVIPAGRTTDGETIVRPARLFIAAGDSSSFPPSSPRRLGDPPHSSIEPG